MRHLAGAISVLALLAGCGEGPGESPIVSILGDAAATPLGGRDAPETVSVGGGNVTVGGPQGYCVDRRGSRLGGDAAFILLASCASITGVASAGVPAAPGLLTASVDRDASALPSVNDFKSFFATDAGRATLARDGQASSVSMLRSEARDDAILMRIRDTSPASTEGLEDTYWRGLLLLNGRLITVTVNSFSKRVIDEEDGRAKLLAFLQRIRQESPQVGPQSVSEQADPPRLSLFRRFQR